jgi:hypothetical protein
MGIAHQGLFSFVLRTTCVAVAALAPPYHAASARVLVPVHGAYLKECGACHMPFSPELLPAASWRRLMERLDDHFGESAKLDAATQSAITEYLVANSADHATNEQSRAVMASLGPGEVPLRITQVPYIAGFHAAVLDPLWSPKPHPKTLAECSVCHHEAERGDYKVKNFSVSDQLFRGK